MSNDVNFVSSFPHLHEFFFSSGFFQRLFGGERKLQVGGASTIRPSRYIHPTFSSAPVFSSPPCQSAFPGWYKGERMQPVPAHTAPVSRRSLNSDFSTPLFRLLEFFVVSYWPVISWTNCADSNRKKTQILFHPPVGEKEPLNGSSVVAAVDPHFGWSAFGTSGSLRLTALSGT